ncbi:MAG: ubiquitin-like domain-containing protein [Actinomycetota bacterium]|nr:ubiquitin-like domain-containing protein [Actinomycetota bacterium]
MVLIGTLAVAAMAYGGLDKTINLRVEGRSSHLHTFALTVRDALTRAGVRLGEGDWVSPPLGTRLHEGSAIEIRRAKEVTIILDGKPRRIVTTALTIEQVLADLNVRRGLRDFVGPSRSSRVSAGMTVIYREAVGIMVQHDGKTDRVITNAPDVGTVLREMGVRLGARDLVRPVAGAYPVAKMVVRVMRVGDHLESQELSIAYPTIYRRVLNQEYGTTRTIQEGRSGVRLMRYRSTYVDGRRVKRRLLNADVVRPPAPRIVGVGAGFPGCACKRGSSTGDATWYNADGLTAAHPWLPFGTVVRVENLATGAWVNVIIRDRGPYGAGRIIDLSDGAFARIARLSKGIVRVKIRW